MLKTHTRNTTENTAVFGEYDGSEQPILSRPFIYMGPDRADQQAAADATEAQRRGR